MISSYKRSFTILAALLMAFIANLNAWETAIAGVLTTPPAQSPDGHVFSTADDRALHCLDAETGREYWNFRPGRKLKSFTVVSPDGSILILTSVNDLVSVSPGGRELWRIPFSEEPLLSPAVDPYGTIYVLTASNTILCIDRRGTKVWEKPWSSTVSMLFATHTALLVSGEGVTTVLQADGSIDTVIDDEIRNIVYREGDLFWQNRGNSWKTLNMKTHTLTPADSPLDEGILFADEQVLITYEGKIVAGRKDWFMEALEAGEDAYDPYYQKGANPGRSSGIPEIPGEAERIRQFAQRGGAPLLPLLSANPAYLNQVLKEFESVDSFQELISKSPDYDLVLQEIVSDSNVVSFDVHRERLDAYSRFRIYRILSRWGNLRSRETLMFLLTLETDPDNLALILDGLGRIGLDRDGRSMLAIQTCRSRFPHNRDLTLSAVRNASLIARYNGNKSIASMMTLFAEIQQGPMDRAVLAQIRKELGSF
ncbi:MAG: PQQ-binding-like beta-propeller repeat protein [Spirochaetales bacterium]|nr:PQQ-binding-like beta-propeller repeat protein [Spirochaetales bacterium]